MQNVTQKTHSNINNIFYNLYTWIKAFAFAKLQTKLCAFFSGYVGVNAVCHKKICLLHQQAVFLAVNFSLFSELQRHYATISAENYIILKSSPHNRGGSLNHQLFRRLFYCKAILPFRHKLLIYKISSSLIKSVLCLMIYL